MQLFYFRFEALYIIHVHIQQDDRKFIHSGIPYPLQLGLLNRGLLRGEFDLSKNSVNKHLGV
jgi:hypothetical protein